MKRLKIKLVGILILIGMLAGILSVLPVIDSAEYLTDAFANSNQVIKAAIFQFVMSLAYLGIAILLYSTIKKYSDTLATGEHTNSNSKNCPWFVVNNYRKNNYQTVIFPK